MYVNSMTFSYFSEEEWFVYCSLRFKKNVSFFKILIELNSRWTFNVFTFSELFASICEFYLFIEFSNGNIIFNL